MTTQRKKEEKSSRQLWQFSPPIGNAYVKSYVTIARSDLHTSEAYICVDNSANRTIADKKICQGTFWKRFSKISTKLFTAPNAESRHGP